VKRFLLAALCLILAAPCLAQTADTDPATRDDVILYLQTMHSHDMVQRMMEVQSKAMQQMMRDQMPKEKQLSANFNERMKKWMDDLIKNMPIDEMTQAMIPAYQKHFTHGDIEAMNTFYSSPVGQKVLQVLPEVSQEGMQEMMPILNKYLTGWKERMQQDLKPEMNSTNTQKDSPAKN
jgi:hypothetical protein